MFAAAANGPHSIAGADIKQRTATLRDVCYDQVFDSAQIWTSSSRHLPKLLRDTIVGRYGFKIGFGFGRILVHKVLTYLNTRFKLSFT